VRLNGNYRVALEYNILLHNGHWQLLNCLLVDDIEEKIMDRLSTEDLRLKSYNNQYGVWRLLINFTKLFECSYVINIGNFIDSRKTFP
jgi:hypothetical protein